MGEASGLGQDAEKLAIQIEPLQLEIVLMSKQTNSPFAAQDYFVDPLRRIEFYGSVSAPIWATTLYDPDNLVGISDRFLENAPIYTATYTHSENTLELFQRAFANFGIPIEALEYVLDFGTGPGTNTVMPLHMINPKLKFVATDISLPLLAILSKLLDHYPLSEQVQLVAWDCMSDEIKPGTFDLVTGASLLHHLMDPALAIKTAYKALKPGGYAIFFEPFDGASLVLSLYKILLSENLIRNERLREDTVRALEALVLDYEARLFGTKPEDFTFLEDKWIFSPEWVIEQGKHAGFKAVDVHGNHTHRTIYKDYVLIQIRMAAGADAALIPDWALERLDVFSAAFTQSVRTRLLIEGTIVMRK
jgi:SAM-dependent methyltransferase